MSEPAENTPQPNEEPTRKKKTGWSIRLDFELLLVILIIIPSVLGPQMNGLATRLKNQSEAQEVLGFRAESTANSVRSLHNFKAYQHFESYLDYIVNARLVELYEAAIEEAEGDELARLVTLRDEAAQLATTSRAFFPVRYIGTDGSYNIQRELDELWAEEEQREDLNPSPYYEKADRLHVKSTQTGLLPLLASISLLFFAFTQAIHEKRKNWRYFFTGVGVSLLIAFGVLYFYFQALGG
jgi:hypothetical protein